MLGVGFKFNSRELVRLRLSLEGLGFRGVGVGVVGIKV